MQSFRSDGEGEGVQPTSPYIKKRVNCDALCDLVPFEQFKKREKHQWRRFTFSKFITLLKLTLSIDVFHVFQIEQMVANRAKLLNYYYTNSITS